MIFEREIDLVAPIHLVDLEFKCFYRDPNKKERLPSQFLLPSTSSLCHENPFALVSASWSEEGLFFNVESDQPAQESFYPSLERGDAIEIFIDTRNLKSSGFNTRFCHHFFFLPQSASGHLCGEITRFRTDDKHDLCDPKELFFKTDKNKKGYEMMIRISSHAMTGYDPNDFDKIGFSYRISGQGGRTQHFSSVSDSFPIEQRPSLWSQMKLCR